MKNHEIAQAYIDAGHRFVPLKGKLPIHKGYHERDYTLDDLNGHNAGLMVGNGLVDIDLDWHLAQRLFGTLPRTNAIFGRIVPNGIDVTHCLYRCDIEPIDFCLPKIEGAPKLEGAHAYTILQIRSSCEGKPYHVMCPPSTHPDTKQEIDWSAYSADQTDFMPAEVKASELIEACGEIAAMSFFIRFYPGEGARDDFICSLVGTLLRGGWSHDKTNSYVETLARICGDNEISMRAKKALRSDTRLKGGRKVMGLPTMAKLMGVPIEWCQLAAVWLGVRQEAKQAGIVVSPELPNMARQAWDALAEYQREGNPAVYLYGDATSRLNAGKIEILGRASMRYELARATQWLAPAKKPTPEKPFTATKPPQDLVTDMLASRISDRVVQPLEGLTTIPIFTAEGKLIDQPGYDFDTGVFYDPTCEVSVGEAPTPADVQQARDLLLSIIQDFPFVHESDRAHSFALMFEHVAREMWQGPSPMYYFNKPSPGTGASLLASCISIISLGEPAPEKSQPTNESEWEKVITSYMIEGAPFTFFDNADSLASPTLAMALTSMKYKGRILGASEMIEVPVRCSWVATGNNAKTTNEIYRRMIDIRLDAQMESPEDRPPSMFAIPNLRRWVQKERSSFVSAVLTIVKGWVQAGMPDGTKAKASYEDWARVMGGIVEFAGVEGFLETPKDRKPADANLDEIRGLLVRWMRYILLPADRPQNSAMDGINFDKSLKASELVSIVEASGCSFDFRGRDPDRVMGDKLSKYMDQVFNVATSKDVIKVTLRGAMRDNSMRWYIEFDKGAIELDGDGGPGSIDEPKAPF